MNRLQMLESISERLESFGYQRFQSAHVFDRRDIWMRRDNGTAGSGFASTLYLQFKPNFKAYSVSFGVSSPQLMDRLARLLAASDIRELLRHWRSSVPLTLPCWNLFDAGRGLDWRYLSIPDQDDPEEWEGQLRAVQERFLAGLTEKIADDLAYVRLLSRNDKPFEWWTSDPVLRCGEIVLALMQHGGSEAETLVAVEGARDAIAPALADDRTLDDFVHLVRRTSVH